MPRRLLPFKRSGTRGHPKGNQNKGNVSLAEALVVELKVEVGLVKLVYSYITILSPM